jgi:hypothetical protein
LEKTVGKNSNLELISSILQKTADSLFYKKKTPPAHTNNNYKRLQPLLMDLTSFLPKKGEYSQQKFQEGERAAINIPVTNIYS